MLSCAYLNEPFADDDVEDLEFAFAVHALVCDLPASDTKLSEIQSATQDDEQLQKLHQYITTGWPTSINNIPLALRNYCKLQNELDCAENLILLNNRIVTPLSMRPYLLKCIHQGHMGIEKSKARARVCVYWPNMYGEIENTTKQCVVYNSRVQQVCQH